MQYNYEALDPESFQKFAQSLVVASYPDAVSFPVGQPDGGRDAIRMMRHHTGDETIAFQIKFSRNPMAKTERDVVIGIIETEKAKVQRLIEKGLNRYIVITNVQGTAHLDAGSIDAANSILSAAFDIPTQVWWRDDLDRRVDNSTDIKWSYLQICSAQDVLPFLLRDRESAENQRIDLSIKSYLSKQYSDDKEVKFKQVELKKNITDIYVDLPMGFQRSKREVYYKNTDNRLSYRSIDKYIRYLSWEREFLAEDSNGANLPVAGEFFLQIPLDKGVSRFVLEGAPGQGKSTATQYICQVNRLRLLKRPELANIPSAHRDAVTRIPLRVDLRDFAAWVSGRHPFATMSDTAPPAPTQTSLESFLAMQVSWFSGGLDVTITDLQRFLSKVHAILVLDGFDEIADVETRDLVVQHICDSSERFETNCLSMQIIVTSRPAAFANSPGFPATDWMHLELKDLRKSDIDAYTKKWLNAQDINDQEGYLLSATLEAKLKQPHLRDLARNPMQLAILLHLLHLQGVALPDKRTSLYEKYMDLFFNREAEKSKTVQEHRDLLMSIHGYLGWVLHIQAENNKGSGSVEEKELYNLVKKFLEDEDYEVSLADELFSGLKERVVALVSRVKGTWEFEVQPLREYFTARHLYQTSAYSPLGGERTGSRPDRFAAIAKSRYWTNVTRFFCGFYDKGELAALADSLADIGDSVEYKSINQARNLAILLLSDWVFAQSPRSAKRLIAYITEYPAFYRILAAVSSTTSGYNISLPERSGRKELREYCLSQILTKRDDDERRALRLVARQNSDPATLKTELLEKNLLANDENIVRTLAEFGLMNEFDIREISEISENNPNVKIEWLCRTGQSVTVVEDEFLRSQAFSNLFSGKKNYIFSAETENWNSFSWLATVLRPMSLASFFKESRSSALQAIISRHGYNQSFASWDEAHVRANICGEMKFAGRVFELFDTPAIQWQKSSQPWNELVNAGFDAHSERHLFLKIAFMSTAVRSREEKGLWSDDGWATTPGLVNRLRYARLKSGSEAWWTEQIEKTTEPLQLVTCLAILIWWSTRKTLFSMCKIIDKAVLSLPEDHLSRLNSFLDVFDFAMEDNQNGLSVDDVSELIRVVSDRLGSLLLKRLYSFEARRELSRMVFARPETILQSQLAQAFQQELSVANAADVDWEYVEKLSRQAKSNGIRLFIGTTGFQKGKVPELFAEKILADCENHCLTLVHICEVAYSNTVAQNAMKVAMISQSERWFT